MAGKRRPLNHSASLFKPPLTRSSHSAPSPQNLSSNKPPLFTSCSESRATSKPRGSPRSSTLIKSASSCQNSVSQKSISTQGSQDKSDQKSSASSISNQLSSFVSLTSWMGLHVAHTVVSDLLTSPLAPSNSLDPNNILDRLIEQIKEDLKQGYV